MRRSHPFLTAGLSMAGLALGASACGGLGGPVTVSQGTTTTVAVATDACPAVGSVTHGPAEVAVVFQASSSPAVSRCVPVGGSGEITALAALRAAGVEVGTQSYSFGLAICQVAEVPAHYSSCLPSGKPYWALFVAHHGGAWTSASTGVSGITLRASDSLGLRYDPAKGTAAAPSVPPPL